MLDKQLIKKWIIEILTPILKLYDYKIGNVKEWGGEFGFFKRDQNFFSGTQIQFSRNDDVDLTFESVYFTILNKKLHSFIDNQQILNSNFLQIIETCPYYDIDNGKFDRVQHIESKSQLEAYLQPLIEKFPANVKLVEHYKYSPNLLQKWDEVSKEYEITGNYDPIVSYFPSPFNRHFVYYLAKLIDYKSAENIYTSSAEYFQSKNKQYEVTNPTLSREFYMDIVNLKKIKTYFDNLTSTDLENLKQEFAPFLKKPD